MAFILRAFLACLLALLPVIACVAPSGGAGEWWGGQGPVIAHRTFPGNCALCHTTESWQKLKEDFSFDHAAETGVTLVGAHADAQCLRCHNDRGPVQEFAARGCSGCHVDPHQGQLGQTCESCHDEHNWSAQGQVAEHARTRFPLMGVHAALTCDRCHPGIGSGSVEPLNPECVSCHQSDLAAANSPDHMVQGWVDSCERCHLPTTWSSGGFRHDGFRLTGAHATAQCEACHVGGVYVGIGDQCADCHIDEYNSVSDPDHVGMNFSLSCDQCHSTNAWLPANFSHQGIHDGCVDCHLAEYNATTDPNHITQGYAQTCEDCHSTNTWIPANFDHAGITSGCVDCHLSDYNQTSDPDHAAAGYSTQCEDCHDTDTWDGAGFNHAGITNGCDVCHIDDYNQTSDPNHAAAGFPTQCEACHNTNQWHGATFDHNFVIDRGAHKNLSCTDCHLNSGNYSIFSCIHCHDHRKSKMDDVHDDEAGYVWENSACYSCHPTGED